MVEERRIGCYVRRGELPIEAGVVQGLVVLLKQERMRPRLWCMIDSFVDRRELETSQLGLGEILPLHAGVLDVHHDGLNKMRG